MTKINLAYPEKSNLNYHISKFPDGQQQVSIYEYVCGDVLIETRLNNFMDLEVLMCTVASLRQPQYQVNDIYLYVPYILGSRSDRKFEHGSNNYLRDVICPILRNLNFKSIETLDPHSDVLEACLPNLEIHTNQAFLEDVFDTILRFNKEYIVIAPDAGALKKLNKLYSHGQQQILCCTKSRDAEGKLSKVEVPINDPFILDKDLVIIDDICDGGATFVNIAKEIHLEREARAHLSKGTLSLIVTHGIFSKGFDELSQYFDNIICTNSYQDILEFNGIPMIKQIKII